MERRVEKRWDLTPQIGPEQLARMGEVNPLIAQLLFNRGIRSEVEVNYFLEGTMFPREPEKMIGVTTAVQIIFNMINNGEKIVIYGDYDADGITATALLTQTLEAIEADVLSYIPHRVDEGYGLNHQAIQRFADDKVSLIITVDCGIRDHSAVQFARDKGLNVIVTDHHTIGATLPVADVVINPKFKENTYPTKDLAGVGVAFILAYALLREKHRRDGKPNFPNLRLSDLLDLVAIGTIADMMPLNDPINRLFVNEGLRVIRENRRLGLKVLISSADLQAPNVDANHVAFRIAPRLNAAGRLADANLAHRLLLCTNEAEAFQLADALSNINQRRQFLTNTTLDTVRSRLNKWDKKRNPMICVGDSSFVHGIVGLVAGRLTEEWYHPAVIWEQGEMYSHASCRSIPEFNIIEALDECDDLLIRHGGHVSAAGFTVHNENLDALIARLQTIARKTFRGKKLLPALKIDAEIGIEHVNIDLLSELNQLEPTGYGNPQPLFLIRNLKVNSSRTIGKNGKHLSLQFVHPSLGYLRGVAFNMGDLEGSVGIRLDVVTYIQSNYWNGKRYIELNIQDFRNSVATE